MLKATSMVLMTLICSAGAAQATITTDTVRQRAEQACYNNVMKYCNDDVPDEAKIAACMGRNRSKLDPECRAIYDRGM